jgi:integrase
MSVKVIEIYPGKWYVRVVYKHFRKTKRIGSRERAMEVGRKLTTALELYGFDAWKMFKDGAEPAVKSGPAVPTVCQYQARWLEELEKTDLKRSTKESYKFLVTKHVVPAFGSAQLDDIDYSMIKRWVIRMSPKYSKDTVRLMVAVLRLLMQEAVNEGILQVNPVAKLGRFYRSARKVKERIDPFTIEELHLIEARCRERFPEHYGFILCMARTGMRIGEVTALQWHDIDFEKSYIVVRRNIPHHGQVETTKTAASQRRVDMSPELAAELRKLRTERKKQALADGESFDAEEWVFRTAEGTPIHYTNFLRRVWHRVQDIAKVRRRTPHDLRHSWASHMLAAGADLAYVSNQLGHSNPSITLRIYSHWIPGMRRVTTAVLDNEKNASNLQMQAEKEGKEGLGKP